MTQGAPGFEFPRKSVSAIALDRLLLLLERGDFGPGDRLPSQREIADTLGISRPSVREAVAVLQAIGLVEVSHGRGVYVPDRPALGAAVRSVTAILLSGVTFAELFEVRRAIEMDIARLAATSAGPGQIALLRESAREMRRLSDPEEFAAADVEFHVTIALAAGNRLWIYMLDMVRSLLQAEITSVVHLPGRLEIAASQHVDIVDAIASRKPDRAAKAMAVHLAIHEETVREMTARQQAEGAA
jgi:GntR family transcriptional repressor for pyruvate dehydrogenase complex